MTTSIRATKLYVPQLPTSTVARSRLIERLDDGLSGRLTLLSAPAGFGKTTAAAAWVGQLAATSDRLVAWLSLDEGDDDPARFLAYLTAALHTAAPQVGARATGLLESSPSPDVESVLTSLLNDVAAGTDQLVLVLDDYHAIDSEPVDAAVTFILEHLPPRLHVVITTREDPRLPLPRLRARGQLAEVRAADLRFTASETATFLTEAMRLDLSSADAERLETRTEGWIAGLQLAALSLRGREDVAGFIDSFTGSHRFVLDYLVEEVLKRQPDRVRDFLVRTSILDRLSGPLCDAVTGADDGEEMLATLERGNYFIVPLDDHRRWYRYHQLFADVLRSYALTDLRDHLDDLHRRASGWHEKHGSAADAVRHAVAGRDAERAADLIERATPEMRQTRQGAPLRRWIEALPPEVVRRRPMLSMALAATLLDGGELGSVEEHLAVAEAALEAAAERVLAPAAKAGGEAGDEAAAQAGDGPSDRAPAGALAQLPGLIAMHRAGLALVSGDAAGAVRQAWLALDIAPEDDHAARGGALGLLGLALWSAGDLEAAHRTFAEGMTLLRVGGFVADAIGGAATLADIRAAQGRLDQAIAELEEALLESAELGGADPRGALGLHVSMGELLRERNDLDGARRHLRAAEELGERAGWSGARARWCVAAALLGQARGDLDGVDGLLDQARRSRADGFSPNVRPVAAVKARTSVARGRTAEALAWAEGFEVTATAVDDKDRFSYLREYEHITLARVLLAAHGWDLPGGPLARAAELLDRLLAAAEAGGRTRSMIEVLVLQALAGKALGDLARALDPLERALTLAEPHGYARVFLDEGSAMEELLRRVEGRLGARPVKRLCRQLLAGLAEARSGAAPATVRSDGTMASVGAESWLEPLTEREHEVLRLIAQGLSNRAIAQRLFRAESTIKGQNRVIFDKLQVESRTEAIARARELGLL